MTLKDLLFLSLGALTLAFLILWWWEARKARPDKPDETPQPVYHSVVAFVMCFFDTLGIGNFAPTTALFKMNGAVMRFLKKIVHSIRLPVTHQPGNSVRDEWIPGTLNVGYALQTAVQAFIYIAIVTVDALTLTLMIAASVVGAWLGAGVVARWPRRYVQIGMGFMLLGAATLMLLTALKIAPGGGVALALNGPALAVGLVGNFILGALMTLGIGLYGPCLILVSLLGMDPRAAFPIMMGSCAFLMPVGGLRFIKEGSYSRNTAIVMTIAGIPAVLVAAYVFKQLSIDAVRWLVVAVVLWTAAMMLRSAFGNKKVLSKPEA